METLFPYLLWPRWSVMWGIALLIFAACKLLTWPRLVRVDAPCCKRCVYLLGWPGMDPVGFVSPTFVPRVALTEWIFAAAKFGFGAILLGLIVPSLIDSHAIIAAWLGMIGILFVLHFGLFHLLSCCWRTCGLHAVPLMDWPIAATSLADFWGRRWNRAFRDLTHTYVFQPLCTRISFTAALCCGFFLSGVVHDLVISLSAGGGYGGPTLYFTLQAAGLVVERRFRGWRKSSYGGTLGRIATALILIVPLPLLLHRPFLERVIVPFFVYFVRIVMNLSMSQLFFLAGIIQLGILIASALVPVRLDWKRTLADLPPLVRQLFWVYGAYVVLSIVSLGLVCLTHSQELAERTPLARAICLYGLVFWGLRLSLQPFLHAREFLTTWWLLCGYHLLTLLFLTVATIYALGLFTHAS